MDSSWSVSSLFAPSVDCLSYWTVPQLHSLTHQIMTSSRYHPTTELHYLHNMQQGVYTFIWTNFQKIPGGISRKIQDMFPLLQPAMQCTKTAKLLHFVEHLMMSSNRRSSLCYSIQPTSFLNKHKWGHNRRSTKKRLKSASKPHKTAGNCISANPKFICFWGKGGPPNPPPPANSRVWCSWKASGKSSFSCTLPLWNTWLRHWDSASEDDMPYSSCHSSMQHVIPAKTLVFPVVRWMLAKLYLLLFRFASRTVPQVHVVP